MLLTKQQLICLASRHLYENLDYTKIVDYKSIQRQEVYFVNEINDIAGKGKLVDLLWSDFVIDDRYGQSISQGSAKYFNVYGENAILKNIKHAEWKGPENAMPDVILTLDDDRKLKVSMKGLSTPNMGGGGFYGIAKVAPGAYTDLLKGAGISEPLTDDGKVLQNSFKASSDTQVYIEISDQEAESIIRGHEIRGGPIDYIVSGEMSLSFSKCSVTDNVCSIRIDNATLYTPESLVSKFSNTWILGYNNVTGNLSRESKTSIFIYPIEYFSKYYASARSYDKVRRDSINRAYNVKKYSDMSQDQINQIEKLGQFYIDLRKFVVEDKKINLSRNPEALFKFALGFKKILEILLGINQSLLPEYDLDYIKNVYSYFEINPKKAFEVIELSKDTILQNNFLEKIKTDPALQDVIDKINVLKPLMGSGNATEARSILGIGNSYNILNKQFDRVSSFSWDVRRFLSGKLLETSELTEFISKIDDMYDNLEMLIGSNFEQQIKNAFIKIENQKKAVQAAKKPVYQKPHQYLSPQQYKNKRAAARKTRIANLQLKARAIANKVFSTGVEEIFYDVNDKYERRIVHEAAQEIAGIGTESLEDKSGIRIFIKTLQEMYSPPVEFMADMSDIGGPMVRQLYKYIAPYSQNIKFTINDMKQRIEIKMYFDGKIIGSISANQLGPGDCNNAYSVGLSEILGAGWYGGSEYEDQDVSAVPPLFKDKSGYGPILYELMLEYISIEHKGQLTQDREEVSDHAYGTWEYYFYKRPDVFKNQLDLSGDTDAPWKLTKGDPSDDCWETASMEHYEINTDQEPWDDVPTPEYIEYIQTSDPLMKTYYKKDNPFYRMLDGFKLIYKI